MIFDNLKIPDILETDCVLHYSTFLCSKNDGSKTDRREGDSYRDFNCIKKNIELLSTQKISDKNNFRLDFIISVNGNIEIQEYIDYLSNLNNSVIGNNINVVVFQRPNIGYQWGGFYDVWSKYKNINCNWFTTMESDVYFNHNTWYDYCVEKIQHKNNVGFLGQFQDVVRRSGPNDINPKYYNEKWLWRDKNNNPTTITRKDIYHTRGGFYFCKKSFLQNMDDTFHNFTHSKGHEYFIDGILLGEVGFCQKSNMLGYKLFNDENIAFVRNNVGV